MSTNENLHPGGFYVNKSCAGLSSGDNRHNVKNVLINQQNGPILLIGLSSVLIDNEDIKQKPRTEDRTMKNTDKKFLNLDHLENISGGYLFDITSKHAGRNIEVIDDKTGDVVAVFRPYEEWEARKFAQDHGLSTEYITWDQVRMLRVKGPKIGELPEIKGPQIGNPPMGQ